MAESEIVRRVKAKYGQAARAVQSGGGGCCGDAASPAGRSPVTANLYATGETAGLPAEAVQASLGCGNPIALAELRPGDVVLDLGSGGGLDVLLAARRVGPGGRAYGLDMTDEMLALARENQARVGVDNAEFLRGQMEAIPLPDASVDVIVSNCVINLAADKARVFAEAFRVLRPGGRLAVADVVVRGAMPEPIRRSLEAWTGCVAGALEEQEYVRRLDAAGFEAVAIEPTRVYRAADARAFLAGMPELQADLARRGLALDALLTEADGKLVSAFVRATKPGPGPGEPEITPAAREDLDAVLGLLAEAALPQDGVREHFADFLVARRAGRVVGAVGLERYGTSALLRSLVVAPGLRGRGLGQALTDAVLEAGRQGGVRRVFLLTETAAPFFAARGFRRIGRDEADPAVQASVEFTTVCCRSAACMRRDL